MVSLAVFVSHPIQYQVPIWRGLSERRDISPVVHYLSDSSVVGALDPGFGRGVAWDVPMLEGYEHRFISRGRLPRAGLSMRIKGTRRLLRDGRFDAVLLVDRKSVV